METLKGRSSLHEYIIGLMFLITISKGSACEPPSSPECFRRVIDGSIFICEWSMRTTDPNVTFYFHIGKKKCRTPNKTLFLTREEISIFDSVDIWVEARVGNSSCVSTNRSVVLSRIVKFEAPQNPHMSWSKHNLNLNWAAAGCPAVRETLFRRSEHDTWENRTDVAIGSSCSHLTIANLTKDSVYLLKMRHRYSPKNDLVSLWSDWSPVWTVPAELEQKPEVTTTTKLLNGTRKVTLKWKAMPHAVSYILNDTQSLHKCPCKKKEDHNTTRSTHTIYVSLSAVEIWVMAQNYVGFSPPAIVQLPAEPVANLTICNKTALDENIIRKTCGEWYEHKGGDSLTENVIRMKKTKKKKEIEQNLEESVRYLYFEHKCTADRKPQTVKMCLFYQKEGVPQREPQDFASFRETQTSADLSWKEIPSADRQVFLTHYTLCSVRVSSQDEVEECRNISASLTKYRLENLSPGGKYNINLSGVTRGGKGPKATVTISTLREDSIHVLWSLGMLVLFFSIAIICTCILKRIKNKIFPHVPKPAIQDFNPYQPEFEEFLEGKEEVDELTLHHLPEVKSAPADAEETTVFTQEWDDGSDLDDRVGSMMLEGIGKECLGSTDEAMRSSGEGEMKDLEQMHNEIARLIYRNGLVFDIKTDSP
ncbi:uncharacterized protein il12rb1 isoform 2-T2 [Spinachia spinachia]